jgi:hypothetical protein
MSERLGPEINELNLPEDLGRFGDKKELVDLFENAPVRLLGKIEDYYKVPPHRNVVELAHVNYEIRGAREEADLAIIESSGHELTCVFKPYDGEDKSFHRENGLGAGYSRERAAYLISEHFGFDLVPPTVIRTIGGRVGSLQLFMPYDRYRNGSDIMPTLGEESLNMVQESPDLITLAVLDWIIAQADRHSGNYLVKIDPSTGTADLSNDQLELIAIDNGISLNDVFYRIKANRNDLPGPYKFLTQHPESQQPVFNALTASLRMKVEQGLANKQKLTTELAGLDDIDPVEIEKMWQRAQALLGSNSFLSGYNYLKLAS